MRKIQKKDIMWLAVLNLALLPVSFMFKPAEAEAMMWFARDCCKSSQEGQKFCCDQCCVHENCDTSKDCGGPN